MNLRGAFSLIELMVVIAIVAILAAIAVPSYKQYIIKAKVAAFIPLASGLVSDLNKAYQAKGAFPSSITVNNINVPSGGWTTVNYANMTSMSYSISADRAAALLQFNISGLGLTGTALSWGVRNVSWGVTTVCGTWTPGDAASIPLIYLPPNCTCANISNYIFNNGSC